MNGLFERRRFDRWPNLFVVGAARCGTTSLWEYLGQHPDVFMAAVKEPHFFSGYERPSTIRDESRYLDLFSRRTERWLGEASPSYLWSVDAAARIHRCSPDARIVVCVRRPLDRIRSLHRYVTTRGEETGTLEEALAAERSLVGDARLTGLYVGRSQYAAGIRRYQKLFGRTRVHVIVFDDLVAGPREVVRRLFTFLEVDPDRADRIDVAVHNRSGAPRNRLVGAALGSTTLRDVGNRLVPYSIRTPLERRFIERRPLSDEIGPHLHAALEDELAADRRELETLLGRSLPWG